MAYIFTDICINGVSGALAALPARASWAPSLLPCHTYFFSSGSPCLGRPDVSKYEERTRGPRAPFTHPQRERAAHESPPGSNFRARGSPGSTTRTVARKIAFGLPSSCSYLQLAESDGAARAPCPTQRQPHGRGGPEIRHKAPPSPHPRPLPGPGAVLPQLVLRAAVRGQERSARFWARQPTG